MAGKEKLISLGTYPDVSLKDARGRRDEARVLIADKRDPSTERKAENRAKAMRDANSFVAVALEWFDKQAKTCDAKPAATGDRQTALALRLLCLTFVRTSELIGAAWSEFRDLDGDSPTWEILAERLKAGAAHIVPLSRQAVAVLDELYTLSTGSRYVLPGRNPDKPISNNTLLFALCRLGYKGRMTGHGFRAVASSALNEAGYRPDVIERQLAHKEPNKVRAAYNRTEYLPERRMMMQQWADLVDACGKVVPMNRPA